MHDNGFTSYFETSAKDGNQIDELRVAVLNAIDWTKLDKGTITHIFDQMQQYLLQRQRDGLLLCTAKELRVSFERSWPADAGPLPANFKDKFDANIAQLERRDLLRRFSYGDLVLLQPEYLDAYASSIINAALSQPDGPGSILLSRVYAGDFDMSKSERLPYKEQERLLLPAVVEDFLRLDLAFQDGDLLIFPSQVTREHADYPEPPNQTVIFTCEGPLTNIYATLSVRLARSGPFTTSSLWKNAALYNAKVGGECAFYYKETEPGKADFGLFFDDAANEQTRFTFEEFIAEHLAKYAIPGSLSRRQIFKCEECGQPVPDSAAARRRERGFDWTTCTVCDARVSLRSTLEHLFDSTKERQSSEDFVLMQKSADEAKQTSAMFASIEGEARTPQFTQWSGADPTRMVLVFADVVDSPNQHRDLHGYHRNSEDRLFDQINSIIHSNDGYLVKSTGDLIYAVFRNWSQALTFVLEFTTVVRSRGVGDACRHTYRRCNHK